jgi:phospholipase C
MQLVQNVSSLDHPPSEIMRRCSRTDFWAAAQAGNMPAVSFLKAVGYQDGHPGLAHSDPLDEQNYLVSTLNHLQRLPEWNSTAVIITWDDSDGWYVHVMPPIVSQSSDSRNDRLLGVTRVFVVLRLLV